MSGQRDDAAERSAHVTRGDAAESGPSLFVEGPGPSAQLRVVAELRAEVARLLAEREVMRAALGFYADVSKYPAPLTGGMGALWADCGQRARAALSGSAAP